MLFSVIGGTIPFLIVNVMCLYLSVFTLIFHRFSHSLILARCCCNICDASFGSWCVARILSFPNEYMSISSAVGLSALYMVYKRRAKTLSCETPASML